VKGNPVTAQSALTRDTSKWFEALRCLQCLVQNAYGIAAGCHHAGRQIRRGEAKLSSRNCRSVRPSHCPIMCAQAKKLYHNCDTKPVLAAQTGSINESRLLILRNLLKTQESSKIPAYRLIRHIIYSQILIKNAALKFSLRELL
jgi:hypothetical protein